MSHVSVEAPPEVHVGDLKPFLAKIADGTASLTEQEAQDAFAVIMDGRATPAQAGGFLMALRARGETVAELTGAARILRARALCVSAAPNTIDVWSRHLEHLYRRRPRRGRLRHPRRKTRQPRHVVQERHRRCALGPGREH